MPLATMFPSPRRAALVLVALVLPGLWLSEIRPSFEDRAYDWPGHSGYFHQPTYLLGDCIYYRATIVSLLEDRDLDLSNNALWTQIAADGQVALGARGEWYPKHPIGLSLAALPFYAALGDQGLLLFNLLQVAALDLLIFALARRYSGDAVALLTALLFAFGTLLRPAAYNFSPDVFSTALVLGGTLALLSRRTALAGLLLGLSVTAKWTNLALLPPAALWALLALGLRPALRLFLASAPPLLALGGLNLHMFGSPLIIPYDRVLYRLLGPSSLAPSHRDAFDLPFFPTLWRQLVDREKGLLRSAPPALFALPGFALLFRSARSDAALLFTLCAVQLAVFAPYHFWDASSYGHRFLLTAIALSAAPVAALLSLALGERPAAAGANERSTVAAGARLP